MYEGSRQEVVSVTRYTTTLKTCDCPRIYRPWRAPCKHQEALMVAVSPHQGMGGCEPRAQADAGMDGRDS